MNLEEALRFYAEGHHFKVVDHCGMPFVHVLDKGEVARQALLIHDTRKFVEDTFKDVQEDIQRVYDRAQEVHHDQQR